MKNEIYIIKERQFLYIFYDYPDNIVKIGYIFLSTLGLIYLKEIINLFSFSALLSSMEKGIIFL